MSIHNEPSTSNPSSLNSQTKPTISFSQNTDSSTSQPAIRQPGSKTLELENPDINTNQTSNHSDPDFHFLSYNGRHKDTKVPYKQMSKDRPAPTENGESTSNTLPLGIHDSSFPNNDKKTPNTLEDLLYYSSDEEFDLVHPTNHNPSSQDKLSDTLNSLKLNSPPNLNKSIDSAQDTDPHTDVSPKLTSIDSNDITTKDSEPPSHINPNKAHNNNTNTNTSASTFVPADPLQQSSNFKMLENKFFGPSSDSPNPSLGFFDIENLEKINPETQPIATRADTEKDTQTDNFQNPPLLSPGDPGNAEKGSMQSINARDANLHASLSVKSNNADLEQLSDNINTSSRRSTVSKSNHQMREDSDRILLKQLTDTSNHQSHSDQLLEQDEEEVFSEDDRDLSFVSNHNQELEYYQDYSSDSENEFPSNDYTRNLNNLNGNKPQHFDSNSLDDSNQERGIDNYFENYLKTETRNLPKTKNSRQTKNPSTEPSQDGISHTNDSLDLSTGLISPTVLPPEILEESFSKNYNISNVSPSRLSQKPNSKESTIKGTTNESFPDNRANLGFDRQRKVTKDELLLNKNQPAKKSHFADTKVTDNLQTSNKSAKPRRINKSLSAGRDTERSLDTFDNSQSRRGDQSSVIKYRPSFGNLGNELDGMESIEDLSDMSSVLDDSNIHEQTRNILERASSYKFGATSPSKLETRPEKRETDLSGPSANLPAAAAAPPSTSASVSAASNANIGLKEEKEAIDALQKENFQLKLQIVVMDDLWFKNSETGVAELKKQLSICQTERITIKHENDKLRKTLSTLRESHDEDYQKSQEENLQKIHQLEEELKMYKSYYDQGQQEINLLNESLVQAEILITGNEATIENYKNNISDLIVKNESLEVQAEVCDRLKAQNANLSSLVSSLQAQTDNVYKRLSTDREATGSRMSGSHFSNSRVADQFSTIQKALAMPNGSTMAGSTRSTSRATSRLGTGSVDVSLDGFGNGINISEDNPVFSHMLNQIQAAALDISQKYRDSMAENDKLRIRLNQFVGALEEERQYSEELNASGNEKIEQLMQTLAEKDRQLMKNQEYMEALDQEVEQVKMEIDEMEGKNAEVEELKDILQEKRDAYDSLERQYRLLQEELQAVTLDIDEIQNKLNEKDKELERLQSACLSSKEEATSHAAEVKKLQTTIATLKAKGRDSNTQDQSKEIKVLPAGDDNAQAIVADTLEQVQNVANFEQTTVDTLSVHLASILDEYKHTQLLSSQLVEANEQTNDLLTLLEEKDQLASNLGEKIEALRAEVDAKSSEIKKLQSLQQQQEQRLKMTFDYEKKHEAYAREVDDLQAQLEEQQNEEMILREELDSLHSDLEKALKENKNFENGEVVSNEEYEQLHQDFEQLVERLREFEMVEKESAAELKSLEEERGQLEIQVEELQESREEYKTQVETLNNELDEFKAKCESLQRSLESKLQLLTEVSEEKNSLSNEYELLTESFAKQSEKLEILEKQVANSLGSTDGSEKNEISGSASKGQAYRRMLELEVETQNSQSKIKVLESELRVNKEKHSKRSREFLMVLREIIDLMDQTLKGDWSSKMAEIMTQTQNTPGYVVDNFLKIGALINEGIKTLDFKKRKYKYMAEGLKKREGTLITEKEKLESLVDELKQEAESKEAEVEQQEESHRQQLEFLESKMARVLEANGGIEDPKNSNGLDNAALVKKISQDYNELDTQAIKTVGGEIAMKVWEYRYHNMKTKFEKEREARKLEHDNYVQTITQYEDKLAQDQEAHPKPGERSRSGPGKAAMRLRSKGMKLGTKTRSEQLLTTSASSPSPPLLAYKKKSFGGSGSSRAYEPSSAKTGSAGSSGAISSSSDNSSPVPEAADNKPGIEFRRRGSNPRSNFRNNSESETEAGNRVLSPTLGNMRKTGKGSRGTRTRTHE